MLWHQLVPSSDSLALDFLAEQNIWKGKKSVTGGATEDECQERVWARQEIMVLPLLSWALSLQLVSRPCSCCLGSRETRQSCRQGCNLYLEVVWRKSKSVLMASCASLVQFCVWMTRGFEATYIISAAIIINSALHWYVVLMQGRRRKARTDLRGGGRS